MTCPPFVTLNGTLLPACSRPPGLGPDIHVFRWRSSKRRGWPACACHDGMSRSQWELVSAIQSPSVGARTLLGEAYESVYTRRSNVSSSLGVSLYRQDDAPSACTTWPSTFGDMRRLTATPA